jgi:integral membrane protein
MKNKISEQYFLFFKYTAFTEGWSYILLLFLAMPLKYIFDFPHLIRPLGMAHGVLFVAYIVLLIVSSFLYQWQLKKSIWLFVVSLIPFGTLIWKKDFKL